MNNQEIAGLFFFFTSIMKVIAKISYSYISEKYERIHPVVVIAHMKGREARYKDEIHAALWSTLQVHETAWIMPVQKSSG